MPSSCQASARRQSKKRFLQLPGHCPRQRMEKIGNKRTSVFYLETCKISLSFALNTFAFENIHNLALLQLVHTLCHTFASNLACPSLLRMLCHTTCRHKYHGFSFPQSQPQVLPRSLPATKPENLVLELRRPSASGFAIPFAAFFLVNLAQKASIYLYK